MKERDGFRKTYVTLIYVSVFFVYYILFLNQGLQHTGPLGEFVSETYNHILFSKPFLHGKWLDALRTNFEPLLHVLTGVLARVFKFISGNDATMNLANAAAFLLSSAKAAQFIIVKKIVENNTTLTEPKVLFVTTVINFCTVLYLPFISLNIYLPMLTPNILIDPTNILLGPLAILFFYLYVKHYIKNHAVSYKSSILLSVLLIAATLVKPAFTNVMLVVIGFYYLINVKRFRSLFFLHDLIVYLPACLILIWQLVLITNSSAGGGVEFAPYKVIKLFTNHPIVSLFQAVEFPLLITLVYWVKSKKNPSQHMQFAWAFCIVAYLIYALFSFTGPGWHFANLAWSYQIALTFLYVFSVMEYASGLWSNKAKVRGFLASFCAINFSLIFLSGIHQFVKIFMGGFYR